MAALEDDEYEIPLRDQRYFGAGIKRKRIQFVPSSTPTASTSLPLDSSSSAAEKYLSIVLRQPQREKHDPTPFEYENSQEVDEDTPPSSKPERTARTQDNDQTCDICRRSVKSSESAAWHESSMTHQICLQHSHPPPNIDRKRKGLAVLETQGWNPEGRQGLGALGEGRLYPVKAKANPARAGLGMEVGQATPIIKPAKLDAAAVRLMENNKKKHVDDLRNAFYRSEEVERYLAQDQVNCGLDVKMFRRAKHGD